MYGAQQVKTCATNFVAAYEKPKPEKAIRKQLANAY